ncbi:MAG: hypothetical protein ACOC3V_01690 [bacterium]
MKFFKDIVESLLMKEVKKQKPLNILCKKCLHRKNCIYRYFNKKQTCMYFSEDMTIRRK